MPLLGRHKSLQSQSSKSAASARQQPSSPSPPPLVCESPLFGIRRQLPSASPVVQAEQPASSSPGTTRPLASSISLTHNLASAASGSKRGTGSEKPGANSARQRAACREEERQKLAQEQLELTLGSIPKQITRQQIHYAFSIMDTNADGLINLRDLSQMLANLGVPIDEAILSHVLMSKVSKRGDHLINESEFLDWIGNFIQVSDLLSPSGSDGGKSPSRLSQGKRTQAGPPGARKSPVGRSSSANSATASSSLAAHSPEAQYVIDQQLKQRRGSGSGLALMRSLSSSAAATPETSATNKTDDEDLPGQLEQLQEARNDLRAAFCVFDLDGDGFITIDEVQQGLKLLGETWSQQELNQVFSKCDGATGATSGGGAASSKKSKSAKNNTKATDLSREQRISIDDFVKLLL